MTGTHPDLGPELRQLALAVLDKIDPAVRLAAARAAGSTAGPGKCQQVWCPVCALAALAAGEHHPLLNVIAEHSVALMSVVRAMVDNVPTPPEPSDAPPRPPGDDGPDGPPPTGPGRYQHIPVTVED